jgi:hypothetical protein
MKTSLCLLLFAACIRCGPVFGQQEDLPASPGGAVGTVRIGPDVAVAAWANDRVASDRVQAEKTAQEKNWNGSKWQHSVVITVDNTAGTSFPEPSVTISRKEP